MKSHVLAMLPLSLVLSSCFNTTPYDYQQPPQYRDGVPYYPYGPANGGYRSPQAQRYDGYQQPESGTYEQLPAPGGNNSRPQAPTDLNTRPIPQSYDPDGPGPSSPPAAPQPQQPQQRPTYPTAQRMENPNHVRSPYAPYNTIDVSGIKSGHLAKDPSNGQIFRVP